MVPVNHSDAHWSILIIDKKKNTWIHLDPLIKQNKPSPSIISVIDTMKASKIIEKNAENAIIKVTTQIDFWSCGAMIMMVVKFLL